MSIRGELLREHVGEAFDGAGEAGVTDGFDAAAQLVALVERFADGLQAAGRDGLAGGGVAAAGADAELVLLLGGGLEVVRKNVGGEPVAVDEIEDTAGARAVRGVPVRPGLAAAVGGTEVQVAAAGAGTRPRSPA